MNLLDQTLINKISFSIFNGKSYYGYKPSILKSGICKYFRREEFGKFEWCIIEMVLFGISEKGKALTTNLTNRLKILLMEEVSPLEIGALSKSILILENITFISIEESIKLLLEFVSIIKTCKRCRITSYVNNWWRYNSNDYNLDSTQLDKIIPYSKKEDTYTLLKLGELLIKFIDERSESIVDIYTKLYNMEGIYGRRYKRKDAVYMLWEIVENKFKHNKSFMKIFNFALSMFNRKSMNERRAFGVWICIFVWKYDHIDWKEPNIVSFTVDIKEYIKTRLPITIDEDYVINDYHVNKKFGLKKFGNVGSKVINEDLSLLENGDKYRQFYIDIKNGLDKPVKGELSKKKIVFKKKKSDVVIIPIIEDIPNTAIIDCIPIEDTPTIPIEDTPIIDCIPTIPIIKDTPTIPIIPIIDWVQFSNIKVIDEGVCGLKVPCIKVTYNGKLYIVKEMRKSFNYGRDYVCMDMLKPLFNIKSMNMTRIKSTYGIERTDLSIKTFRNNWKLSPRECIYSMMDYFDNIGDLGKHKGFLQDTLILKECLKIRLYDGLFRSSDNILRNILVNKEGVLLSIDEGDIFGKRVNIFNKNDPCTKVLTNTATKSIIDEILIEFDSHSKISNVEKTLKVFQFEGCVDEMKLRFTNYKDIVYKELGY
uniref:Uncharacterized protein n=1 Tax=viral metagenome TaxID=1070528 RepID=A0A6C0ELK5_9ZZZZ